MGQRSDQSGLVDVQRERESPRGWWYDVVLSRGPGATEHAVSLSWADHDHWSGGSVPPSRVVEMVLGWLAEEHPEFAWPARFDVATVRRWFPEVDEMVGRRL
jgi:hypothetical protein